jgi:hypothetical protein
MNELLLIFLMMKKKIIQHVKAIAIIPPVNLINMTKKHKREAKSIFCLDIMNNIRTIKAISGHSCPSAAVLPAITGSDRAAKDHNTADSLSLEYLNIMTYDKVQAAARHKMLKTCPR